MGNGAPNCRSWFVLVVLGATIGSLCAAFDSWEWCAALTAITLFPFLVIGIFSGRADRCIAKIILLIIPVLFFAACKARSALIPHSILLSNAGRSAILELRIGREINNNKSKGTITYEAEATKMLFPYRQDVGESTILVLNISDETKLGAKYNSDVITANVLIRNSDGNSRAGGQGAGQLAGSEHWHHSRIPTICLGTVREIVAPPAGTLPSLCRPVDNHHSVTHETADRLANNLSTGALQTKFQTGRSQRDHCQELRDWQRGLETVLSDVRLRLAEAHTPVLGGDLGALLTSMVLGDKAVKVPSQIVSNFRRIGLSHVLAASGFNLTIVTSFIFLAARASVASERKAAWFAIAGMLAYVALAGQSPSIMRAAIMTSVLLISKLVQRRVSPISALCSALLITQIVDPQSLTDIGLQLSYVATLGITCSASQISAVCQFGTSRISATIASIMGTCLAAQLAVLPIQVFFFHTANIFFLVSNMLVLPFVAPITIVGFACSFCSLCSLLMPPFIGAVLNHCISILDWILLYPLKYIQLVTSSLASCDWAQLYTGQPETLTILIYYLLWALFLAALRRGAKVSASLMLPLGAILILLSPAHSPSMTIVNFKEGSVLVDGNSNAIGLLLSSNAHWDATEWLVESGNRQSTVERYMSCKGVHSFSVPLRAHRRRKAASGGATVEEGTVEERTVEERTVEAGTVEAAAVGGAAIEQKAVERTTSGGLSVEQTPAGQNPIRGMPAPPFDGKASESKWKTLHRDFYSTIGCALSPDAWQAKQFSQDAIVCRHDAAGQLKTGILAICSADALISAPDSAGQYLSFLQGTFPRHLLVRLDAGRSIDARGSAPDLPSAGEGYLRRGQEQYHNKHGYQKSHTVPFNPRLLIADIGKVLNTCGIDHAIIVVNPWQYQRMATVIDGCPAARFQKQDLVVESARGLVAVTITRNQINGFSRTVAAEDEGH